MADTPPEALPGSTASKTDSRKQLANLTPWGQLQAGRLWLRIPQLFVGLTLFGAAAGLFLRAHLGLDPWNVFHQGIANHTGLQIGTVVIITGIAVLLLWVPLRQWPGLGTVANAIWIGVAMDATLAVTPDVHTLPSQLGLYAFALVINGIGGAMYIGAQLGPGPRDGLMTGLNLKYGISVRLARTSVEVTVLIIGVLLGGQFGVGTIIFALTIGPLVQFFLPYFIVPLDGVEADRAASVDGD